MIHLPLQLRDGVGVQAAGMIGKLGEHIVQVVQSLCQMRDLRTSASLAAFRDWPRAGSVLHRAGLGKLVVVGVGMFELHQETFGPLEMVAEHDHEPRDAAAAARV